MKKALAALAIVGALFCSHPKVEAQAASIGPGTPCTVTVVNPTTNKDGSPLTVAIQKLNFYLDPPSTGPVIGTAVPLFSVTLTAAQGAAGVSNTVSVCKNAPSLATGNHTGSISAVDIGGESAGSTPTPFSFVGVPSAAPSGITFQ